MDKTEQYIKMCEKADEIQKEAPFNECDLFWAFEVRIIDKGFYEEGLCWIGQPIWFCCDDVGVIGKDDFFPHFNINNVDIHTFLRWAWLPRQDQLQEMLPEFVAKAGFVAPVANSFADFAVACANNPNYWNLKTFEQLWLAFVMMEKYNKVWDSKQWTK